MTAGGIGCQLCHGKDATGLLGPDIRGRAVEDIQFALANVKDMSFITLSDEEIAAVSAYLAVLQEMQEM